MPDLTRKLAELLGAPVLDKTGVTGKYDFHFEYSVEGLAGPLGMAELTHATLTGALGLNIDLQKQLGLNLKETTGTFDAVVIDRIDEMPAKLSTIKYCVLPTVLNSAAGHPYLGVPGESAKIASPRGSLH